MTIERLYHGIACPTLTKTGPCNCQPCIVADAPAPAEPSAPLDRLIEIVRRARLYKKVGLAGSGIQMHQLMQVEVVFSLSDDDIRRELLAALRQAEAQPLRPNRFDCSTCGPGVGVDADGCCRTCGADAVVMRAEGRQDGLARSPDTKEDK